MRDATPTLLHHKWFENNQTHLSSNIVLIWSPVFSQSAVSGDLCRNDKNTLMRKTFRQQIHNSPHLKLNNQYFSSCWMVKSLVFTTFSNSGKLHPGQPKKRKKALGYIWYNDLQLSQHLSQLWSWIKKSHYLHMWEFILKNWGCNVWHLPDNIRNNWDSSVNHKCEES